MNKQILAIIVGIIILSAFLIPSMSNNTFAQVTSESRVLQAILGLTEVVKGKSQALVETSDNIEDDLLFKKKFWQIRFNTTDLPESFIEQDNTAGSVLEILVLGFCEFPDEGACAYNIESIQLADNGTSADVGLIVVDTAITDIFGKNIETPTNLLVDMGIGKIGVNNEFIVLFGHLEGDVFQPSPFNGIVEFNGEKPQGMDICVLIVYLTGGAALSQGCFASPASQQSFIDQQLSLAQQLIP
jgi:hypothetical protein